MLNIPLRNSFRSLINQRPYSFVNILGMTIGIASVLMLIIWISVETSYEKFNKDQERMYRIAHILRTPTKDMNEGSIYAPAGPEFKKEFPVIEESVRFVPYSQAVIYQDKTIELAVYYTDSTFFNLFSFELAEGDKKSCLASPQGIVITERGAKKIFGSGDPLGKEVFINGNTFTVTAVAKDPPVNTNMQFDCLAPVGRLIRNLQYPPNWEGGLTFYTYVRLIKGADYRLLEKQILEYLEGVVNKKYREFGYAIIPYLQKISSIHLDSKTDDDMGNKGNRGRVYIFSGIGLLILLIACFNFINISTALSFRRAREVSVRKIFGSDRKNIILFFITESGIAIIISLLLAFLLVKILLPGVAGMIGKDLTLSVIKPSRWLLIFGSLFVFSTLFASFYSSFYLSSINPLALLTTVNRGLKKQSTRNILVTFQYTISIALMICCLVIYSQMQYVKNYDLGFNEKDILQINLNSKTSATYELIRDKISAIPGVLSVAVSAGGAPGLGFTSNGYIPEGVEKPIMINALYVDENYLKTMGITLTDGRDFRNLKADSNKTVINKTLSKSLGWNNPVGKSISRNGITYEVIGVVKDFNTSTMHNKIEPIFISTVNEWGAFENIIVRFQPSGVSGILKKCESIIKEIDPQYPFEYQFLEDSISSSYLSEHKMNTLFLLLAVISIFISSLGLFGLATFATQSRMKEISIRKINGAMISDIFWGFNFELLKWILISFVVAIPVAYYAMTKWLDNFAFRTSIGAEQIIAAGLAATAVGLVTVSWAAMKAAQSNPAETLRKE
jgi:putative ABC transport system permease protein